MLKAASMEMTELGATVADIQHVADSIKAKYMPLTKHSPYQVIGFHAFDAGQFT